MFDFKEFLTENRLTTAAKLDEKLNKEFGVGDLDLPEIDEASLSDKEHFKAIEYAARLLQRNYNEQYIYDMLEHKFKLDDDYLIRSIISDAEYYLEQVKKGYRGPIDRVFTPSKARKHFTQKRR